MSRELLDRRVHAIRMSMFGAGVAPTSKHRLSFPCVLPGARPGSQGCHLEKPCRDLVPRKHPRLYTKCAASA